MQRRLWEKTKDQPVDILCTSGNCLWNVRCALSVSIAMPVSADKLLLCVRRRGISEFPRCDDEGELRKVMAYRPDEVFPVQPGWSFFRSRGIWH